MAAQQRRDDVRELRRCADAVDLESDNVRLKFCSYTLSAKLRAIADRLEAANA